MAKDGTLDIKLAKDITVDSVKTGNTTVNTYGVSIANADPNKVVSLTASGLNNGNNRITNVAAGQAGTDGVNVSQLQTAAAAASNTVSNKDGNIKVTKTSNANGSTDYEVVLNKDLTVGDKTTPGTIIVKGKNGKDGVSINGADGSIGLNGPYSAKRQTRSSKNCG